MDRSRPKAGRPMDPSAHEDRAGDRRPAIGKRNFPISHRPILTFSMPTLPRPKEHLTDGVVTLRPFTLDDVSAVTAACQDPEINRWTASIPWPYEEEHARGWITNHHALWERGGGAELAMTAASDGRLLGSLGLVPIDWDRRVVSAGYWVVASERGRSVATRALHLGTNWALGTLGLAAVELVTMVGNVASERVAQKAGFSLVEEIPNYEHPSAPDRLYQVKRWRHREAGHR
jgi:RimJ/RimL family protein N-acetyltransferase